MARENFELQLSKIGLEEKNNIFKHILEQHLYSAKERPAKNSFSFRVLQRQAIWISMSDHGQ